MNWGLRARVTLWSVAANGVVLLLGTLVLFWSLDVQLTDALDEALAIQARSTGAAVEAWLTGELKEQATVATSQQVQKLLTSDSLKAALEELFSPPKDVPADQPSMVSLLDVDGALVLSTHEPSSVDVPDPGLLKIVRSGAVHRTLATVTDAAAHENAFRVATAPVKVGARVEAFVQVLAPLHNLRSTLSRVQSLLAVSVVALLLLNGLLVSWALRRAFRSVDVLVQEIHRITDRNLAVRVNVPVANDEIRRLSETFNAMLDRLDKGFQFQTQLFQDLSHQLKTPLAILMGTLETSLVKARTAEEYRSTLESNLDEVGRMTSLIEGLLLLARLDSQQVVLQLETVDWSEFCRTWADDFELLMSSKELTPVWSSQSELWVRIDRARLGQALLNLLDNAVKYSPTGGFLFFRLSRVDDWALLELENQGPALEPGSEEAIFQRFFRQQDGKPGFGLGLPIARAAVELHRGHLTAYTPQHGGAGFRLALPLSESEENLISG